MLSSGIINKRTDNGERGRYTLTLKRYAAMIAVLAVVLSLTACSGAGSSKEREPDIPEQKEPQKPVREVPDAEIPPEDDTLRELRTVIKDKNCTLGAAFLGYASAEESPKAILEGSWLYNDYPFLKNLPDSSFKDAGGSEVYLFVPMAGRELHIILPAWLRMGVLQSAKSRSGREKRCRYLF